MQSSRTNQYSAVLKLFNQLSDFLFSEEQEHPVSPYKDREELLGEIDFSLIEEPMGTESFVGHLEDLIRYSPKTASTMFFNQLFGGRQPEAVLGELLAVLLNNSMYTYKAGGPQILLEKQMIQKMISFLGFPESASGTMAPGGSMTNLMGLIMARDIKDQEVRHKGMRSIMCLYTSQESHYSTPKNAAFAGIGRDQVRTIEVDNYGRMKPEALEETIKADLAQGYVPFLINATAGTTVMGAFDPFDELADISERYGLWLHVDGAYCGSVIFSESYRHLIKGAERANSFTLNAHKMLGTPLSSSFILVRDSDHLHYSFSNAASYLYQTHDDELNPGKVSLQCGRRNDALKLWTLWKALGTSGLRSIVDHQFELADAARKYVREHPDYELYSFDQSVSVCFNYKDISAVELCNGLYENSEVLVGFGEFGNDTFVRLVTINAGNEVADIHRFFEKLEAFAQKMKPSAVTL